MTTAQGSYTPRKHSNAYNIFILVLTVLSLAVMVVMLLPISEPTLHLLSVYDNLICVIFLIDFFLNLTGAAKKCNYFIKERGWLDLLGSIPSLGWVTNVGKFAGLFRLARLSRFARITRLLRGENKKALVKDVLENRSRYALFITIWLTLMKLPMLYEANEFEAGSVSAFRIGADGALSFVSETPCGGKDPAYISVHPDGRFLFTANYASGARATALCRAVPANVRTRGYDGIGGVMGRFRTTEEARVEDCRSITTATQLIEACVRGGRSSVPRTYLQRPRGRRG